MNRKPNSWWFVFAVPLAMLSAYLIWLIRFYSQGGWNDIVEMGGYAVIIGFLTFPIGAPFFIWINAATISQHLWIFSLAGYLFYMLIIALGWRYRTWALLVLLCLLLLANIAGCHMNHTTESLPLSQ